MHPIKKFSRSNFNWYDTTIGDEGHTKYLRCQITPYAIAESRKKCCIYVFVKVFRFFFPRFLLWRDVCFVETATSSGHKRLSRDDKSQCSRTITPNKICIYLPNDGIRKTAHDDSYSITCDNGSTDVEMYLYRCEVIQFKHHPAKQEKTNI